MARQHQPADNRARDVAAALQPRVELVDNWHVDWPKVLTVVDRVGHRAALHIDADGWLSARQSLIAAFVGETAAGHLCFRVQPIIGADGHVLFDDHGKPEVEAFVECFGVDEIYKAQGIESLLVERAKARAEELRCRTFRISDTCGQPAKSRRIDVK